MKEIHCNTEISLHKDTSSNDRDSNDQILRQNSDQLTVLYILVNSSVFIFYYSRYFTISLRLLRFAN